MAEGIGGRGLRWMLRGQERQANSGEVSKSCRYEGVAFTFWPWLWRRAA
jgi:hypothetical protein